MNEQLFIPRAILMDKETGTPFEVNLQSIDPWPPEPDEEEPEQPMVFNQTVTVKLSKKDSLAFKRMLRRQNKVPRKLKKACRHIYLPYSKPTIYDTVKQPDGTVCCIGYVSGYRIKPGYPHTKWARKALTRINRSVERSIKELFKNNEKPCHNT